MPANGLCAHDALPHTFNGGVLNESANIIEGCNVAFDISDCRNFSQTVTGIGIESMVTRTRLRYTYVAPLLWKNWCHFQPYFHTVMLWYQVHTPYFITWQVCSSAYCLFVKIRNISISISFISLFFVCLSCSGKWYLFQPIFVHERTEQQTVMEMTQTLFIIKIPFRA